MQRKRGQTWSIDLVLGVVIFTLVVTVFYTLITKEAQPGTDTLQRDAEMISNKLDAGTGTATQYAIIKDRTIDSTKVNNLKDADYQTLKDYLGVDEDFCIYVEDENGNVVPLGDKIGVGSPDIYVGDLPCGSTVS